MLMVMWERDLEIRHLVALRAVAAERSFGRAGERLGFTQSAISQQIAALERVWARRSSTARVDHGPVELTPVGRVVLAHAESVLRQLSLAEDEVGQLRSGRRRPSGRGHLPERDGQGGAVGDPGAEGRAP